MYSASHLSPACDEKKQNECFVFKVKKGDMMFQDKLVMLFENPPFSYCELKQTVMPTAEVDASNRTLRFYYDILSKMTTVGIDMMK